MTMLLAATRTAEDWSAGNLAGAILLGMLVLAAVFWAILVTLR